MEKKETEPHLIWWDELSEDEAIQVLKEEMIYGHDEGVTASEIKRFYNERFPQLNKEGGE